MSEATGSRDTDRHAFIKSVHGVRYQVKDVAGAVAFYTERLGFKLVHQQLPAFASVSLGDAPNPVERTGRLRISSITKRSDAGARRMESCRAEGRRPAGVHQRVKEVRGALSEPDGDRAWWSPDPG